MNVTWFMTQVPGWARLVLAILLFAGISMLIVWRFHDRIVALSAGKPWPPPPARERDEDGHGDAAQDAGDEAETEDDEPPAPFYLAGRIMAITGTAFVFLLAFTLGNFWGNAQDARTAVQTEHADYEQAFVAAQSLAPTEGRDEVLAALQAYAQSVTGAEWSAMESGDSGAAYAAHQRAAMQLASALRVAVQQGAEHAAGWNALAEATDDMADQGTTRINQLPRPSTPGVLALIFVLAVTNLAVTAAFQPAPLATNLVLIGLMATITALLLFIVTEASNPFTGGSAIPVMPFTGI